MSLSWEDVWVGGIVVLGLLIAYGLYRYNTRNRANDPVTEEATRRLYDDPDAYEKGGRADLKRELK